MGEWDINTEIDCPPMQGCNDPPVDVNVEKVIVHEDYLKGKKQERRNDIALLRLNQPVDLTGKYSSFDFISNITTTFIQQILFSPYAYQQKEMMRKIMM